jgi:hypothetical protein
VRAVNHPFGEPSVSRFVSGIIVVVHGDELKDL